MSKAPEKGNDTSGLLEKAWARYLPASAKVYLSVDAAVASGDWRRYVPEQWVRWRERSQPPRPQTRWLRFVGIDEDRPGARWRALFDETWPAYRRWWTGGGTRISGRAEAKRSTHSPCTCRSWFQPMRSSSSWLETTTLRRRC